MQRNRLKGFKNQISGSNSSFSESVGKGGGLSMCMSNKFPGSTDAAGLRAHCDSRWSSPSFDFKDEITEAWSNKETHLKRRGHDQKLSLPFFISRFPPLKNCFSLLNGHFVQLTHISFYVPRHCLLPNLPQRNIQRIKDYGLVTQK